MAKKKIVKAEEPEVEPTPEPEVKVEVKTESPKVCPENACDDLQFAWAKGIFGCFDANSEWCTTCMKDFPETAEICKMGTVSKAEVKKSASPAKRTRVSGTITQVSFLDNALKEGSTIADMVKGLIEKGLSNRDEAVTKRRVLKHIHHLKTADHHKLTITKENGIYKVAV
jgi:hypothetical protein